MVDMEQASLLEVSFFVFDHCGVSVLNSVTASGLYCGCMVASAGDFTGVVDVVCGEYIRLIS